MGGAESVVRNVDKRTSRREHRTSFEAAVTRFRAKPFSAPSSAVPPQTSSSLRVCIRKRPFFPHEHQEGEFDVITSLPKRVVVHDARMQPDMRHMFMNHHDFNFDEVFDEAAQNEHVYARSAQDIVQAAALGGHGTVMMYGQTGSGKTYTMSSFYTQAAEELFEHATTKAVSVYFIELLGDKCFDMLNGGAPCSLVSAPDGSVHPHPCIEVDVSSSTELLAIINMAGKLRATAATGVHDQSSRSHAICRVFVREEASEEEGSLTLVDLAGSEHRIDNAEHNAERQREGAKINASLSALKDCIRATAASAKFVAFRQNRLTQLLRGCFSNVRPHPTVVIATVSPSSKDTEHSLNTLRHACIMDGQGQGKAVQSAHVTGGVVTKETLGEIDVAKIARERRRSIGQTDTAPRRTRQSITGHQSKQSNTVRRATLDKRCLQALPPGMSERLTAARGGAGSERQRARLRPKEETCSEETTVDDAAAANASPVKCMLREDGVSVIGDDANAGQRSRSGSSPDHRCTIHQVSNASVNELFDKTDLVLEKPRFIPVNDASSEISAHERAQPVRTKPAELPDVGSLPVGSPSSEDFCSAAWEEERLPPARELARSPVSKDSAAMSSDLVPNMPVSGPEAARDEGDDILVRCMPPPTEEHSSEPDASAIIEDAGMAAQLDMSILDTMSEKRDKVPRSPLSGNWNVSNPEKVIHIQRTNAESELDTSDIHDESVSKEEEEKALGLFRIFCTEGRDARVWRKNDLRLINTCVLPAMFGPAAHINWAYPNIALDELEKLMAGSSSSVCTQERPRRLHGRQPSQQTTMQEQFRSMHQMSRTPTSLPHRDSKASVRCVETSPVKQSPTPSSLSHQPHDQYRGVRSSPLMRSRECITPNSESMYSPRRSTTAEAIQQGGHARHGQTSGSFRAPTLQNRVHQAASAEADVKRWLQELRQDLRREATSAP